MLIHTWVVKFCAESVYRGGSMKDMCDGCLSKGHCWAQEDWDGETPCPCMPCLIKSMCKEGCPTFRVFQAILKDLKEKKT